MKLRDQIEEIRRLEERGDTPDNLLHLERLPDGWIWIPEGSPCPNGYAKKYVLIDGRHRRAGKPIPRR